MSGYNTYMKTFKDLRFKKQQELVSIGMDKWCASLNIGEYTISVIYGDRCYGNGPNYDTYEVAGWEKIQENHISLRGVKDLADLCWV